MEKRKKLSDAMDSISRTGEVNVHTAETDDSDCRERFSAIENYVAAVYGPPEVFDLMSLCTIAREGYGSDDSSSSLDPEEFDAPLNCEPDDYGPPEMFFDPDDPEKASDNDSEE